jgi:hypothetical protein
MVQAVAVAHQALLELMDKMVVVEVQAQAALQELLELMDKTEVVEAVAQAEQAELMGKQVHQVLLEHLV